MRAPRSAVACLRVVACARTLLSPTLEPNARVEAHAHALSHRPSSPIPVWTLSCALPHPFFEPDVLVPTPGALRYWRQAQAHEPGARASYALDRPFLGVAAFSTALSRGPLGSTARLATLPLRDRSARTSSCCTDLPSSCTSSSLAPDILLGHENSAEQVEMSAEKAKEPAKGDKASGDALPKTTQKRTGKAKKQMVSLVRVRRDVNLRWRTA